jgi:hypothetical protein
MNERPEPVHAELVANVHPPDRKNPEPAEGYHLVVLGAGTAARLAWWLKWTA